MIAGKAASLLLPFAFFLLPSLGALAQGRTMGRIEGAVVDKRGAVIAGALVTVVNKATGDERKATTDREGHYSMPSIPPGIYDVNVTADGFPKAQVDNVTVSITDTTPVTVQLEVGAI